LYHGDHKDFGPRFGVAWDVTGDGKTVVRAAANIMYTQEPIGVVIDINPFGANVPSIGYKYWRYSDKRSYTWQVQPFN
jgi:hypothetical protein